MNVTMIPGYWSKLNSGDYVLLTAANGYEIARIFKGCKRDSWVLCIGDFRHKAMTASIQDAKAELISELARRTRTI